MQLSAITSNNGITIYLNPITIILFIAVYFQTPSMLCSALHIPRIKFFKRNKSWDLLFGARSKRRRLMRSISHWRTIFQNLYLLFAPHNTVSFPPTFHFFSPLTALSSSSRDLPRIVKATVRRSSSCSSSRPRELVYAPAIAVSFRGDRIRRGHSVVLPDDAYTEKLRRDNAGGRFGRGGKRQQWKN